MSKKGVLVVLSGGQDSTTCLAWAVKYFAGEGVHAISFDYGQRHKRELMSAAAVAGLAGVLSYEVIHLGPGLMRGTSPLLTGAGQAPGSEALEQYEDFKSMDAIIGDRVEKTFVPMRNALFLTVAANRAVCLGVRNLVTGVCQADNANYPDCRERFVDSQAYTIRDALGDDSFNVLAPLMNLSKAESIGLMSGFGKLSWLAFTHTAYDGMYPPVGKDHASVLRAHGFEEANLPDPLVLRAALIDRSMQLPTTPNYSKERIDDVIAGGLLDRIKADYEQIREGFALPSPDEYLNAVRHGVV